MLLLGDSGLGKTLSVCLFADQLLGEWHQHRQTPNKHPAPPYLPLLLRPILKSWSHSALQQAFTKVIDYYGLKNTTIPLLLIIDGYDECQLDIAPQNLVAQLGIPPQDSVKLIVTCRPQMVEEAQLTNRFAFQGQIETRYFLPFAIKQVLEYLQDRLSWTKETYEQYQDKLKNIPAIRTVLRNSFVLSLLVQSWETIAKQDFKQLNRWMIYEGFVTHWLTTQERLLPTSVQRTLKGHSASLPESFDVFASELAFTAFQQKGIALSYEQIQQLIQSPWLTVKTALKQSAHRRFLQRQAQLTEDQKRRALLTEEDYIEIMLGLGQQFALGAPLKARALGYEFSHKSFFEYFVAKRILRLVEKDHALAVREGLDLLNTRAIQEEPEVIDFLVEGWIPETAEILTPVFFDIITASRRDSKVGQASANVATLLNAAWVSFTCQDLHGVKISGADLTGALLDHTNFRGADLRNVKLQGAFLRGTDFRGSKMGGVKFGEFPRLSFKGQVKCIAFSPDGSLMAVVLDNTGIIKLWGGANYSEKRGKLGSIWSYVNSIAFSPDGQLLASGSMDNTVRLWKISSGKEKRILKGHTRAVMSVTFSPDGQLLASGSMDNTVRLWEVSSGKERSILQERTGWVGSVAFSPDGQLLASGTQEVRLWEVSSGKEKATLKEPHATIVNTVAFSPDGQFLASGSLDRTVPVRLWEISSGKEKATLQGHTDKVTSVVFSPDGELLASGSRDLYGAPVGGFLGKGKGYLGAYWWCE